jgi:hypothetical protein
MSKHSRRQDERQASSGQQKEADDPAAYGVVTMRKGNTLSWARVRVDGSGVCIVNDKWEKDPKAWHDDTGELAIVRIEEAAVKCTMRAEYGGPHK